MKKTLLFVFLLLGIIAWFSFLYIKKESPSLVTVSSFQECVRAGYQVMESYPRQCKTPDGRTYVEQIEQKITYVNSSTSVIVVDSPLPGERVNKNVSITGKARGAWYFEASFPIQALDASGKVIGQAIAQAQSDWMTAEFVPFKSTIQLPESYSGPVTLVLMKDNPSGLPEHDASISFTVTKEVSIQNNVTIKLYYYNPSLDQGPGGVQCSNAGLVPVLRTVPRTNTPIQDAIKLLLRGEISDMERTQGVTNEFPLEGFTLKSASLVGGELTLLFVDTHNKTVGGSCRVSILWKQIEATAKQFPVVTRVRFLPEELFQP